MNYDTEWNRYSQILGNQAQMPTRTLNPPAPQFNAMPTIMPTAAVKTLNTTPMTPLEQATPPRFDFPSINLPSVNDWYRTSQATALPNIGGIGGGQANVTYDMNLEQRRAQDTKWLGGTYADGQQTNGILPTALSVGQGLMNSWLAFNQLSLAQEQFDFQKSSWAKNYNNQVKTTNDQLRRRQRAANSRGTGNGQSADDYVKQYGVK